MPKIVIKGPEQRIPSGRVVSVSINGHTRTGLPVGKEVDVSENELEVLRAAGYRIEKKED